MFLVWKLLYCLPPQPPTPFAALHFSFLILYFYIIFFSLRWSSACTMVALYFLFQLPHWWKDLWQYGLQGNLSRSHFPHFKSKSTGLHKNVMGMFSCHIRQSWCRKSERPGQMATVTAGWLHCQDHRGQRWARCHSSKWGNWGLHQMALRPGWQETNKAPFRQTEKISCTTVFTSWLLVCKGELQIVWQKGYIGVGFSSETLRQGW